MIETLLKSVREKHQQNPIPKEKYIQWRDDPVTRRLREEMESELIETLIGDNHGGTMDEIARATIARQAVKEIIESVLNWKPVELVKDDDDE